MRPRRNRTRRDEDHSLRGLSHLDYLLETLVGDLDSSSLSRSCYGTLETILSSTSSKDSSNFSLLKFLARSMERLDMTS